MKPLSVVVIGAGIVGLAVAFHLRREGLDVTVVDRDPEGDKASFGNAGGIAVTEVVPASVPGLAWRAPRWLIDPLGPLAVRPSHAPTLLPWLWRFAKAGTSSEVERISIALAALNRRTYDDLLPMLRESELRGEIIQKGALTVYQTEGGFLRDAGEWEMKRSRGVEFAVLSSDCARQMEPALGADIARAVFTPAWSHCRDPKRLVDGMRQYLASRGVEIRRGLVTSASGRGPAKVSLEGGQALKADRVVVAAGAWSGLLAKTLGDRIVIESERGYNTTLADPGVALEREIIFAERKFVATPLSCGLRIGGAAEFGGLKAQPNFRRSDALARLAKRYLPGLRTERGVRWAGHRPTTPDSLPIIGPSPTQPNAFYACGHGHLGLTQAATTGRLIADLIAGTPPLVDLAPYSIARFH